MMFLCGLSITLSAQDASVEKVFLIGEYQKQFDGLIENYETHLLEVCDNSMDEAYKHWTYMLHDLEIYSKENGFDIRGVKLWINVFWSVNGTIDHMVFYPKPNSKNTDYDLLKKVLVDFVNDYHFPIKNAKPFSHYGSASFPTFVNYKHSQER